MADNKLEEIIDLLAEYGGFNREYLRDKLLTFANDVNSETKNKMELIASMFGKKLGEEFLLKTDKNAVFEFVFDDEGLWYLTRHTKVINDPQMLLNLLTGKAVIVDE